MVIAALSIIARTWKQPRCLSADEWIRKRWYIYTMEYYSAIKKNAFESILMRWMKLELIIQSEVSQKEKHQYSMLSHFSRVLFCVNPGSSVHGLLQARILEWVAIYSSPIQYTNTYIWNLEKMVMMTLYARQQRRHRCKGQSF